jgi:hypothetical protein
MSKKEIPGAAWITLNTSYYIPPAGDPLTLLDDASLLLDSAQGMMRLLNDLLPQADNVNQEDLADAMWGISTLVQLGQRSGQEAHKRLSELREKAWERQKEKA